MPLVSEWLIFKSCFFMHISETLKSIAHIFQFQVNSGTLKNVQIPSSKPYRNFYTCRLTEATFGIRITTSKKF